MSSDTREYEQCGGCGRFCLARRAVQTVDGPDGFTVEAWCGAPWWARVPTRVKDVPTKIGAESIKLSTGEVIHMTELAVVCSLDCFAQVRRTWTLRALPESYATRDTTPYYIDKDVLFVAPRIARAPLPQTPSTEWVPL